MYIHRAAKSTMVEILTDWDIADLKVDKKNKGQQKHELRSVNKDLNRFGEAQIFPINGFLSVNFCCCVQTFIYCVKLSKWALWIISTVFKRISDGVFFNFTQV